MKKGMRRVRKRGSGVKAGSRRKREVPQPLPAASFQFLIAVHNRETHQDTVLYIDNRLYIYYSTFALSWPL